MTGARILLRAVALVLAVTGTLNLASNVYASNLEPSTDPSGVLRTFSFPGGIDLSNPFFKSLGTNGRSCATCHAQSDAWSVSTAHLQQRFQDTDGLDSIFRAIDGANCPSADVSTLSARTSAYSLLLSKGLIRMSLPVPSGADFTITSISDPYNCAETTSSQPALYRRPLPATNLRFLPAIMWDGREPNLTSQAKNATLVHAQPKQAPTATQLKQIVNFETGLFTAQSEDNAAGFLALHGGRGGPIFLALQPYRPGSNPDGINVFTLYSAWANLDPNQAAARASIARGQAIFNNRMMLISGVAGFNDVRGQQMVVGTCGTCHNAANVGASTTATMMDIGTSSPKVDLPSYTVLCADNSSVTTTDPGRALITGKCSDLSKFKVPGLRGLAARAPYFHNGTATDLTDVVSFYNQRFNMLLSGEETADVVAFLNSL
ncbi:MAG: hypothetical protein ACRD20_13775 [Terriglobales bacterium]